MTLEEIQNIAKNQKNNAVRMHGIMLRPKFRMAWERATDNDKMLILEATLNNDVKAISQWINETLSEEIDAMTIRQLRDEATRLGIPLWGTYPKYLLIQKVREAHDRLQAKKNPGEIHP